MEDFAGGFMRAVTTGIAMTGALYKMSLMGLLPNTPSDWVSLLSVPPSVQLSSGSSL